MSEHFVGIDPSELGIWVVRPTIDAIGLRSRAAEELLIGTAAVESDMGRHLAPAFLGEGPDTRLGPWQMDPERHWAVWQHIRKEIQAGTDWAFSFISSYGEQVAHERVAMCLGYACALARVWYKIAEAREPLAEPGDWVGHAAYWRRHWRPDRDEAGFLSAAWRRGLIGKTPA